MIAWKAGLSAAVLVRSAPREIRRTLADALAEALTGQTVVNLEGEERKEEKADKDMELAEDEASGPMASSGPTNAPTVSSDWRNPNAAPRASGGARSAARRSSRAGAARPTSSSLGGARGRGDAICRGARMLCTSAGAGVTTG